MSGKFLSKVDIAAAKKEEEIFNSMVKRGEIDTSKFTRTGYAVCGCGAPGCGFIARWMKDDNGNPRKLLSNGYIDPNS